MGAHDYILIIVGDVNKRELSKIVKLIRKKQEQIAWSLALYNVKYPKKYEAINSKPTISSIPKLKNIKIKEYGNWLSHSNKYPILIPTKSDKEKYHDYFSDISTYSGSLLTLNEEKIVFLPKIAKNKTDAIESILKKAKKWEALVAVKIPKNTWVLGGWVAN